MKKSFLIIQILILAASCSKQNDSKLEKNALPLPSADSPIVDQAPAADPSVPTTGENPVDQGIPGEIPAPKLAGTLAIDPNALSIIISPSDTTNLGPEVAPSTFYSIDVTGKLSVLNFFEGATGLTQFQSGNAKDVFQNTAFLFFTFSTARIENCKLIILRKSDKKLFCGGNPENDSHLYTGDKDQIQLDAAGSLYFMTATTRGRALTKINLADPDSPTSSLIHEPTSNQIEGFLVSPSGDVLISEGGTIPKLFVKKINGGIQNLTNGSPARFMMTSDGTFYWIEHGQTFVKKGLRQMDGTYAQSLHAASGSIDNQLSGMKKVCEISGEFFGGLTGIVDGFNSPDIYQFVANPGRLGLNPQGFHTWSDIKCAPEKIYVLGTDTVGDGIIQSYKHSTATWTNLITAGTYSIDKFEVTPNGEIFFSGLRNFDGAKVFARVKESDLSVTEISTNFFEVQKLQPL